MLIRRTNNGLDRIFNEWNRAIASTDDHRISLDVHENDEQYTVVADIPGIVSEDIDIRLHDDVLTISAENEYDSTEERGTAILRERRYGKVSRSLRFPVHVNSEEVSADYTDGVLTVVVPKAEEVKPRRIEVKRA